MVHRPSSATPVSPTSSIPFYVDVVLPRRLHRPFTYLIPDDLKGKVKVQPRQTYALKEAAQAHRDLEARKTTGSTVLIP